MESKKTQVGPVPAVQNIPARCTQGKQFVSWHDIYLGIEVLHDHVKAAMLDGRTKDSLSPEELNSFSCKNILLLNYKL
jgi:hypothetical protein